MDEKSALVCKAQVCNEFYVASPQFHVSICIHRSWRNTDCVDLTQVDP